MSIIGTIKRVFSIGTAADTEPESYQAPAVTAHLRPATADPAAPIEVSAEMVRRIFDGVVEETNRSLPAYLGESVDPERQKQYLYDRLDESVKQYLASLETAAAERCRAQWLKEREAQQAETEALKQRARDLEARRAEINEKQLSAERQKRALQERVHDLETKVITLEAEKEQYEIENKGLVNKAKVAGVYETQIKELQQQIEDLRGRAPESPAAEKSNADPAAIERLRADIARLEDECTRHKREADEARKAADEARADTEKARKEADSARKEAEKLRESLHTAQVKDEMGGAMLNDLQTKASEAIQAAKEAEARIRQAEKESEEMLAEREAVIADLRKEAAAHSEETDRLQRQVAELQQLTAELQAQVGESAENAEVLETISEQIELFEGVKAKLEERVARLTHQLSDAQKENESLKSTIKSNLYAHSMQEKALQDQIDALVKAASAPEPQAQPKHEVMDYPSLFREGSEGDVPAHASSDDRTDDLIADTGWIK